LDGCIEDFELLEVGDAAIKSATEGENRVVEDLRLFELSTVREIKNPEAAISEIKTNQ
jgi:hypothetical protein